MPWRKNLPWIMLAGDILVPLLMHSLAIFISAALLRAFHAVNADLYGSALGSVLVLGPSLRMISSDKKAGVVIPGEKKKNIWPLALALGAVFSVAVGKLMQLAGFDRIFSNMVQERLFLISFVPQILFWGMLIPLAEELIHRGLVYPRLRSRFPLWTSVIISSLIFGVAHGNVIQSVYAFLAGVVLCLFGEYGGLESAVAFHAGANLISVILHRLL